MTQKKWSITQEMSTVGATQVFSGGACNVLNASGTLLRNTERDPINDWLTEQHVMFFDPQIHPDTHGVDYDYPVHHKLEIAARNAAHVNLYQVSPRSFGAITSFEIAADQFQFNEPMVIYFSDGFMGRDMIPVHSRKGHPLFVPEGIRESEAAQNAHYREFIKNGNNARKYLMQFADVMETLTVTFGDDSRPNDVVVTPMRIHAAEMFAAVVRAASGEHVNVHFKGGYETRDPDGNPLFIAPANPMTVERRALLDQYVDEGNALRRAIAALVRVNVFVRVVYTQRSAIIALEELLKIRGIV